MTLRWACRTALLLGLSVACARGQAPAPSPEPASSAPSDPARPLPDIAALIREVGVNQHKSEAIEKDYVYRLTSREEEVDSHGKTKKIETREYEVFWVNGVKVSRILKKNGRELSPEDQEKESEALKKQIAKAREKRDAAEAKGVESDSRGNEEVTASRILELGSFSNARREMLDGRETIAADFTGDPKAKTHNRAETFMRDVAGTVWIDEQDRLVVQMDAHIVDDFKVGMGLVADLHKGSAVHYRARKINGEVWMPASVDMHGKARVALVMGFEGNVAVKFSEFRKFKTTLNFLPAQEIAPETLEPETKEPPAAEPAK